jgi:hypothetical protein
MSACRESGAPKTRQDCVPVRRTTILVSVAVVIAGISGSLTFERTAAATPITPPTRPATVINLNNHEAPLQNLQHPRLVITRRSPNPAGLATTKHRLNAGATGVDSAVPNSSLSQPMPTPVSFQGIDDSGKSPSDSTGAVGTTRYVELINTQYGIYDRSGNSIQTGNLGQLTGLNNDDLSDPQIIWDSTSDRFYYLVLDKANSHFAFGYSMTDSPSSSNDFCRNDVDFGYGTTLPDFPKLGDTQDFLFIGVNAFTSSGGYFPDLVYINKPVTAPGPISNCPDLSAFNFTNLVLKNADGSQAFTPVPTHQIDISHTGFLLTTKDVSDGSNSTSISKTTITDMNGAPAFSAPVRVSVPSFSVPPDAFQKDGTVIDTSDTRLTQAIAAFDPAHGDAIWTQHTVASKNGTSSRIDWYEIASGGSTLFQRGTVSNSQLFVYNGAISPDRQVDRASNTFGYGQDMALTFNTSSPAVDIAIQMVSKDGPYPQSGFQSIHSSSQPENTTFACKDKQNPDDCRWGDYAGASPDPLTGQAGVWFTNGWVNQRFCPLIPCSSGRTWNWEAITQPSGAVVSSFQPSPTGNGRGIAFDPKTRHLFYTLSGDPNIYVVTTQNSPVATLHPGINFGSLSWDPRRRLLWAGAYDGTGNVYTVNPSTGVPKLRFTFSFRPGDSCYGAGGQGLIDGLAYDYLTDTLWLGDDAARVFYHARLNGKVISSATVPFNACKDGIADDGRYIWLAIQQVPDQGPFYYLLLDKANPSHVLGQVPYRGPGGPEGIAHASDLNSGTCVLWSNNFGSTNTLTATDLRPLCP